MKKLLFTLLVTLLLFGLCGCGDDNTSSQASETPEASETTEEVSLPDDITCIKISHYGEDYELPEGANERLVSILKSVYNQEDPQLDLGIEAYMEIEFNHGLQLTVGNNDDNFIAFSDYANKVHKIVSVSAEDKAYLNSLIAELFTEE